MVDQYNDTEPGVEQRIKYLYSLPFPSRWELKRELGKRMLSLGVAATALQIFEELEMWEEVIQCYQLMDKSAKVSCLL